MTATTLIVCCLSTLFSADAGKSDIRELARSIPADAWATLFVVPPAPDPSNEALPGVITLDTAAMILGRARAMGFGADDPECALWFDAFASWPMMSKRAFALSLLEASSTKVRGGGNRLAKLEAVLVMHTSKENADIQARIQHLLNTHVNAESGSIEKIHHAGGSISHRLTDARLDPWVVIEWGSVGEDYVIAIGPTAFDRIFKTRSGDILPLLHDPWFQPAHEQCQGFRARVELTIHIDQVLKRLRPMMDATPEEVAAALGLANVDRALWTIGSAGRAVAAFALFQKANQQELIPICSPKPGQPSDPRVPERASTFAIVQESPHDLVHRIAATYLACKSESTQSNLRDLWAQIQAEIDLDIDRDLLRQLGPEIVIHDYPQHPLMFPLARTIVLEITGSPTAVRTSVDRLMRRWQAIFRSQHEKFFSLQLKQADDGLWFFQMGLYGPALGVTDRWVVIGYSPVAVRSNIALLEHVSPSGVPKP